MYIRLSHFSGEAQIPVFEPPFPDPLIDEMILNFNVDPVLYIDRRTPQIQRVESNGKFGRVMIVITANVHCAEGWNGTNCEIFCANDICNQGTVQGVEGYMFHEPALFSS